MADAAVDIVTNCPHCLAPLPAGALVCPTCYRLVYEARLRQLLDEVQRAEAIDPAYAVGLLRQALALVPPNSQPHQMIAARAAQLSGAAFGGGASLSPEAGQRVLNHGQPERPRNDPWPMALLKTGGSMALSMYVYHEAFGRQYGWAFPVGFVLLILIHELGHVVANWYYGIEQSPPIFIPYVGAIIWLRQNPPSAKAEAVVGIAGPIAGTIGALLCYAAASFFLPAHARLLYTLAQYAFVMNLFNMVPCPPLDGGRVTAAVTPLLWILGVPMFIGVIYYLGGRRLDWITILLALWILQSALPRVRDAIFRGWRKDRYYRVTLGERLMVALSYTLLVAVLAGMLVDTILILS